MYLNLLLQLVYYSITVKPPIIPAGMEWRKAGNKRGMETGGVP